MRPQRAAKGAKATADPATDNESIELFVVEGKGYRRGESINLLRKGAIRRAAWKVLLACWPTK